MVLKLRVRSPTSLIVTSHGAHLRQEISLHCRFMMPIAKRRTTQDPFLATNWLFKCSKQLYDIRNVYNETQISLIVKVLNLTPMSDQIPEKWCQWLPWSVRYRMVILQTSTRRALAAYLITEPQSAKRHLLRSWATWVRILGRCARRIVVCPINVTMAES